MRNDAFSRCHPAVTFAYFAAVLSFSAFLRHPVCIVISFSCALAYALYLDARAARKLLLTFCLPLFVLTALINPAFNHRGTIVLAVFPTGNALTLESIVYGAFSALMLVAVVIWFFTFSKVFTSEKFVWLLGRAFPTLSLLLSATLRFVPEFRRRFAAVSAVRGVSFKDSEGKKFSFRRFRETFSRFSTVVSWSLESAAKTSDSMRSRGYGLEGRTSYSPYHFLMTDAVSLIGIVVLVLATFAGIALGAFDWHYYPAMGGALLEGSTIAFEVCFLLLCVVPLVIDGREAAKWRCLRSAI